MNIILLSGGSGKRLWPLSNDIRSKQFIKIFKSQMQTPLQDNRQRPPRTTPTNPCCSASTARSKRRIRRPR